MRLLPLLLLVGCTCAETERSPTPLEAAVGLSLSDEDLERVEIIRGIPREENPRPDTDFPVAASGCYRCDVTSIYYQQGQADDDDPREEERNGASLRLGTAVDGQTRLIATIEGCPFYVTRAPQPNPAAFALGPNTCDGTRYHDGFVIVRGEVVRGEYIFRHLLSGEAVDCEPIGQGECETWERTEWWVTAQITGRTRSGAHAIHTYMCMRGGCLR